MIRTLFFFALTMGLLVAYAALAGRALDMEADMDASADSCGGAVMAKADVAWWTLSERQASRTAFAQMADVEFWHMRATREAEFVDASVRANIAVYNATRKKARGLGMQAGVI